MEKKMVYWVEEENGDIFESGFTFSERDALSSGEHVMAHLTKQERKETAVRVVGTLLPVADGATAEQAWKDVVSDYDLYEEYIGANGYSYAEDVPEPINDWERSSFIVDD